MSNKERFTLYKSLSSPDNYAVIENATKHGFEFTRSHDDEPYAIAFTPFGNYNPTYEGFEEFEEDVHKWLLRNYADIIFGENVRKRIGLELKEARKKQRIPLRELAERCNLAHQHIFRMEEGKYNATIDKIEQVAKALSLQLTLVPNRDKSDELPTFDTKDFKKPQIE